MHASGGRCNGPTTEVKIKKSVQTRVRRYVHQMGGNNPEKKIATTVEKDKHKISEYDIGKHHDTIHNQTQQKGATDQ